MQVNLGRLNKKIQSLKNKKNERLDGENSNQNQAKKEDDTKKLAGEGADNLLKLDKIPARLDYRNSFLKREYLTALNSLHDYGANSFAQYLITSKEDVMVKQETISLVSAQYLSFRDFGEKLNVLIMKIGEMIKAKSIPELCKKINILFKEMGSFERMKLWIIDNVTGVMTTMDEYGKEQRVLLNKGLIGEAFKLVEPIVRKKEIDKYLYRDLNTNEKILINDTLLQPIKGKSGKVCGILEVNSTREDLTHDDEYFVLVISKITSLLIEKCYTFDCITDEMKHSYQFIESFAEIVKSNNRYEFAQLVMKASKNNFYSNCAQLIFVDDGKLTKFLSSGEKEEFNLTTGVAGYVADTQKPLVVPDISVTTFYNKKVDIYTLLPILVVPITIKRGKDQVTIAVFEISLKERRKLKDTRKMFDIDIGIDSVESMHHSIFEFTKIIKSALLVLNDKFETDYKEDPMDLV